MKTTGNTEKIRFTTLFCKQSFMGAWFILIYVRIVYDCFYVPIAELSNCDRDHVTFKTENTLKNDLF